MRNVSILVATVVATVVVSGCATRGSVREVQGTMQKQAGQIAAASQRIDELDQRAEQLGQRVTGLDGRAEQLGQRVTGLDGRVDGLDTRVGQLSRHFHGANVVETIEVPFRFDRATLDDRAMTRLHELAKELQTDGRLGVELLGYTDTRGPLAYNVRLSERRVDAVRRYLVQRGAPLSRVAAIGLGPLAERGIPDGKKRTVIIRVVTSEPMVTVESKARSPQPPSASVNTQAGSR